MNRHIVSLATAPLHMSRDLDSFLGEPLNAIVNEMSCAAQ